MTIMGELVLPPYRIATASAAKTIFEVVRRLNEHPDVQIQSQIATSPSDLEIRFYILSIPGPGPGPNVEVYLSLRVSEKGITTEGSGISALGSYDEEIDAFYEDTIRELIQEVLGLQL